MAWYHDGTAAAADDQTYGKVAGDKVSYEFGPELAKIVSALPYCGYDVA